MNVEKEIAAIGCVLPENDFWQGIVSSGPILLGVIPFGITCGIMGMTAGLTPLETVLMSILVFAGSSQFIAITMLGAGITSFSILVFTTLLVNLRHLMMGASLAQNLVSQPFSKRLLLSFLLTDEAYALTVSRIHQSGYSASHHLGVSLSLYLTWAASTTTGVLVGSYIPDPLAWGLDFAMPATFLVLLLPRLKDRVSLLVCLVAAVTAVAGALYLPGKWYMIAACLAAVLVGGILEGAKEDAC